MTQTERIRTAMDAIHHGAFDYLAFPAENEQILRSVRQALDHQALAAKDPVIRQRLKKQDAQAGLRQRSFSVTRPKPHAGWASRA